MLKASCGDYLRALVNGCVVTYPLVQFAITASEEYVSPGFLQPCNEPCLYSRVTPLPYLPSSYNTSTIDGGFIYVQNGGHWSGLNGAVHDMHMPGLMCKPSKNETQHYCESKDMMAQIPNTMARGGGKWGVIVFAVAKGIADVAHDWRLLSGHDAAALGASMYSLVCLGITVIVSWWWCSNTAETFALHDEAADCTCYYQRTQLPVMLSFFVPASMLWHLVTRGLNLIRARTYGLYLFSFSDNIPMRVLRASSVGRESITDSLLVEEVCGNVLTTEPLENERLEQNATPEWPSISEFGRVLVLAVLSWDKRSVAGWMPVFPILLNMIRFASSCRQLTSALRVGGWMGPVLATSCLFFILLCLTHLALLSMAASSSVTKEGRMHMLIIWFVLEVVLLSCSFAQINSLWVRTFLYLLQLDGPQLDQTPSTAKLIAVLCCIAAYGLVMSYLAKSYRAFCKAGKQRLMAFEFNTPSSQSAAV